jgi:hypothetical protein
MAIYPNPNYPNVYATSTDGWLVGEPGYNYVGLPGNYNTILNTVTYQLATGPVIASLANPSINTGAAAGDTYTDIDSLTGSPYGGSLYGDNSGLTEQLWALGGTNYLYGGSGYTTFIAGPGPDHMFAQAAGGLADYEVATSGVTVSLSDPSINTGYAQGDSYSNVHNIAGSAYDDVLYADNFTNDNLVGNDGNNTLIVGTGSDTLNGGPGANVLIGGAGNDWYVFGGSAIGPGDVSMDPLSVLYNAETGTYSEITNFNPGKDDRIDVSHLVDSLDDGGQSVGSLVKIVEDTSGSFAWLEFNGPMGWVTLARMDGLQAGETVGVILNESNSAGFSVTVEATQLSNTTQVIETLLPQGLSDSFFAGSTAGPDWQVAGTADFNGDGTTDILWHNTNTGEVAVWFMTNGYPTGGVVLGNPGIDWQIEGTGNFVDNGTSDIFFYNAGDHEAYIWEMSNGQLVGGVNAGTTAGPGWQVGAVGDFTGNGTSDILWHNVGSGDVVEWILSNGQVARCVDFGAPSPGEELAGSGKFFGNNSASGVLWYDPSTGGVDIWQMSNGQLAGSVHTGTVAGPGWQIAGLGDFNGDGTTDILWRNVNTGDVAEWFIANGKAVGGVDLGHVASNLNIVGVGHFTHNGTSDVLWTQNV